MIRFRHAPKHIGILIFFLALAIPFGIWGGRHLHLLTPILDKKAKFAVLAAAIVLTVKYCANATRGREFKLHEQGYDTCLMAAGAALPGAAAAWVKGATDLSEWLFFALASTLAIFVASALVTCVEDSPVGPNNETTLQRFFWASLSFILGVVAFMFYVIFVVIKASQ
jgi:hypothetical protein